MVCDKKKRGNNNVIRMCMNGGVYERHESSCENVLQAIVGLFSSITFPSSNCNISLLAIDLHICILMNCIRYCRSLYLVVFQSEENDPKYCKCNVPYHPGQNKHCKFLKKGSSF